MPLARLHLLASLRLQPAAREKTAVVAVVKGFRVETRETTMMLEYKQLDVVLISLFIYSEINTVAVVVPQCIMGVWDGILDI